ncbi:nickel-binding protein [Flavihumibacter petaseus]|nr:nickel-binding protein [Flavihumibacter petaseus]
MDIHVAPGVSALGVAEAHQLDLSLQHDYGCKCMTYWVDEMRETVFCLIDAPNKEAVVTLHSKAHGMLPSKIIEVRSDLVESFLGRIYDPEATIKTENGLTVFHDPSFRILLMVSGNDPLLLQQKFGTLDAAELLHKQYSMIRRQVSAAGGKEVPGGPGKLLFSFASAEHAARCARAVQEELSGMHGDLMEWRMSISGGEPVGKSEDLFGDAVRLAENLCEVARQKQIALSHGISELLSHDRAGSKAFAFVSLSQREESQLNSLFDILEENWQNAEFDIDQYCQTMAMSKSQLYRTALALTGSSPNQLLKAYRLNRAKDLLRKRSFSVAEIAFEAGFTSPSYFTKCFKEKFGILPMTYVGLIQ